MTTQSLAPSQTKYNRNARKWETWRGDYDNARVIGGVVAFPAGKDGKRGALLSALTADHPAIAAQVDALIQREPTVKSRAIKAGFIIGRDDIELLHYGHYRVQSESDATTKYIVAYYDNGHTWSCQCADWHNGNQKHNYGMANKVFPPFINGIGVACKHVLSVWLYIGLMDIQRCPTCSGRCMEPVELSPVWPTSDAIKLCKDCNATGAVINNPHIDMAYYNEKTQDPAEFEEYEQTFVSGLSFDDDLLSDDEHDPACLAGSSMYEALQFESEL